MFQRADGPQDFLTVLDTFFVKVEYRMRAATLLCEFIQTQPPHLYQVLNTPLFNNILRCLQLDSSTTVVSLTLTALTMLMPCPRWRRVSPDWMPAGIFTSIGLPSMPQMVICPPSAAVVKLTGQSAIRGNNLYLYANGYSGIPGTPLGLSAAIGRSSGSVDDPLRAARLRPDGTYVDWRIGLEHVRGPLTLAVDYVGTDIDQGAPTSPFADARHAGERVLGRVRLSF